MGEKLDFISVKKRNLNMLLKSTKQCPGYFTSLLHLTEKKKKNLWVRCYQHSHFIEEETEARGINEVASM